MMRSMPSALNSRIDTGPTINKTNRTDCNLACRLAASQLDIESTALDVHPGDLVMADACGYDSQPMQLCIGKDTISDYALKDDNLTYTLCGEQFVLDQRAAQYHRDVGDARTGLEYYLRMNQAVVFFHDGAGGGQGTLEPLRAVQPHIQGGHVNHANDGVSTIRKNVFVFSDADYQDDFYVKPGGDALNRNNLDAVSIGTQNVPLDIPVTKAADNTNDKLNIFHINLTPARANVHYIHILHIISTILTKQNCCKTKYITNESSTTAIPTLHLNSAGLSLTHGHMSSRNGDTAFTTNLFAARTDVNGPFKARAGDDIFWIYNCEDRMFNCKTFERHARCVLTEELLQTLVQKFFAEGVFAQARVAPNLALNFNAQIDRDSCLHIEQRKAAPDGTGNHKFPNFVLAARQHKIVGSSLLYMASLRDAERVLGKVISGGQPYSSIDWVHGAGAEM